MWLEIAILLWGILAPYFTFLIKRTFQTIRWALCSVWCPWPSIGLILQTCLHGVLQEKDEETSDQNKWDKNCSPGLAFSEFQPHFIVHCLLWNISPHGEAGGREASNETCIVMPQHNACCTYPQQVLGHVWKGGSQCEFCHFSYHSGLFPFHY